MSRMAFGLLVLVAAGCRKDWDREDIDNDGYSAAEGDCVPGDPSVSPDAVEVCDGRDNNCDSAIDEGVGTEWFTDADADGFGDDASAVTSCFPPPSGAVTLGGDCKDDDLRVHPGAPESCEVTEDLDCDGLTPGEDADGDGFVACEDCDDDDKDVHPGAEETCDDRDEDCDGTIDDDPSDATDFFVDLDGDGFGSDRVVVTDCASPEGFVEADDDCDDLSAESFPNAAELCDGADNDCNGTIDDGATGTSTFWADADKDGYGDPNDEVEACVRPVGYVDNYDDCDDVDAKYNPAASESCTDPNDYNCDGSVGQADGDLDGTPACTDCDDSDASVEPGAPEICDGVDNDCNGQTDETAPTWYADVDGDAHGGQQLSVVACLAPGGFVTSSDDCDDLRAAVLPGATELCDGLDNNCDGSPEPDEADADGDRWRGCEGDCDDGDATAHPGGVELCDGADDDCDGTPDDGALDATVVYTDADTDGFGTGSASLVCAAGAGQSAVAGDCDDTSNAVMPGAVEACNTKDDDCDGDIDEAGSTGSSTYYLDSDGDGVGSSKVSVSACASPAGYVASNTDCDDADARSYPLATELCDGLDNNCDKASLAGEADGDKDNWRACGGDCNDTSKLVNPSATELCSTSGVDDDCDGTPDNNAADAVSWFVDADKDAFGAGAAKLACTAPVGSVALAGDCDDTALAVHPGAAEVCNGADDNCDTKIDNDPVDAIVWFADTDGDGYGNVTASKLACAPAPAGYVALAGDCLDTNKAVSPAADELCSTVGVDDDCDGSKDEGDARDSGIWFLDADNDLHGKPTNFVLACAAPAGRVALSDDCDDGNNKVYGGATDTWYDGVDSNCDGKSDFDQDGDGYVSAKFGGNDCDDTSKLITACGTGSSAATAGRTCSTIHTLVPAAPSGAYWLDPDNDGNTADAYQTWCDMTRDGGGWTLVLNNVQTVGGSYDMTWAQATTQTVVWGGALGGGIGGFDLQVGLADWSLIGTRSRIEVGSVPGTYNKQAFYDLVLSGPDYTLGLSNPTLVAGGVPGIVSYHNGNTYKTLDRNNNGCPNSYRHGWWYNGCWSGSFWAGNGYQQAAYWDGSGGDYWAWGAIWLR